MKPDNELLQQYIKARSEEAFTELVRRHVNLVYSAALRQVGGDAHLAQDVAQNVFTDLARHAATLSRRQNLTGWLYTSTHFSAAKIVRTETRRRLREEEFMREPTREVSPDADWQQLRPILDSAMHGLKDADREAVLLRYFENRPFAEVGAKLGVSENTARMRVERALEKLRALLAKRGITTGAALATVISANAVQTAPVFLAASLARKSIAGAAKAGVFQSFTTTKIQLGFGTIVAAGILAAFVLQQHAQNELRIQTKTLAEQLAVLRNQNANLSNQLAAATSAQADADALRNELLKLRAQLSAASPDKTAPESTFSAQSTNGAQDSPDAVILLSAKFVTVPAAQLPALSLGWVPAGDGVSLLSSEQFGQLNGALAEDRAIRQIDEKGTMTGNERPAQTSSTKSFSADDTNVDIGIIFGATPDYSHDSTVFALNLVAQLKQLSDQPQSGSLVLETSNQVNVFAGQSAVLEQDIPPGSWLSQALALPNGPNKLLVVVTPKVMATNVGWRIPFQPVAPLPNRANPQEMADARQGLDALIKFASDNQGQIPTGITQAAPYLNGGDLDRIENTFQIVSRGTMSQIKNPWTTVLLRENQDWQGPDKKWHRIYGFADGHIEVQDEMHSDFE